MILHIFPSRPWWCMFGEIPYARTLIPSDSLDRTLAAWKLRWDEVNDVEVGDLASDMVVELGVHRAPACDSPVTLQAAQLAERSVYLYRPRYLPFKRGDVRVASSVPKD